MSKTSSREIHLASRPLGVPTAANFAMADVQLPDPAPGQMLVRNLYLSVDPYMRWRMETAYGDPNAVPPIDELERYLAWTGRMRAQMRGPRND